MAESTMLKVSTVQALVLQLTEGGQAVLVQDGPAWNGLQKFSCIAPLQLEGLGVIVAKDPASCSIEARIGKILQMGDGEQWLLLMVSPKLGEQLQR